MRPHFLLVLSIGLALPSQANAQFNVEFVSSWGSPGHGSGHFENPYDLAVGPDGKVYVIDINIRNVQYFSSDGQFLGQWGTEGTGPGQFSTPTGIDVDDQGNVYVVDGSGRVQHFTHDGIYMSEFTDARLPPAIGLSVDREGNIYIGNWGPGPSYPFLPTVNKFDRAGNFQLSFFAFSPRMSYVDDGGHLYLINGAPALVQKFSPTGTVVLGNYGEGACSALWGLWGIAGDRYGNVALTNFQQNYSPLIPNLLLFDSNLSCVATWHINPPVRGEYPEVLILDVDFDPFGYMYLLDLPNKRVLKYKYTKDVPIPSEVTLAPPQPNPSSGRVAFAFSTMVDGPASLTIYDVVGHRIKHWDWPTLPPGEHSINWDGQSDNGRSVAPGVMFCWLTSNGQRIRQKLTHLP